jgi:hypothetical protein
MATTQSLGWVDRAPVTAPTEQTAVLDQVSQSLQMGGQLTGNLTPMVGGAEAVLDQYCCGAEHPNPANGKLPLCRRATAV